MRIHETAIAGVFEVLADPIQDERGFFARVWCVRELAARGIADRFVQASVSQNTRKGTVRGFHFQRPPSMEGKLVRCEQGKICDIALDLRPTSPTFLAHVAVELDDRTSNALFIPPGVAHCFQTLEDDCRVLYTMTDFYEPGLADGVRWNDPAFAIALPLPVSVISERDRDYPDFDRSAHALRFGPTKE
jgi:dTDP-4-dehydrorhamnose 3,5-epimerase